MNRSFFVDVPQLGGILAKQKTWKLSEMIKALQNAYCKNIGLEFMHIPNPEICTWLRNEFELN